MSLSHLSDHDLLSATSKLVGSHRELTAKLVAHLAEVEERRLHLVAGFSSMFEFCINKLALSEGAAFRRLVAARLSRRFPVVLSLIASGAVHLSALELLRDKLTDENHAELFEAASGKTKREVEAWLAARFPKPDAPSRIRQLPDRPPPSASREPFNGPVLDPRPARTHGAEERAHIRPLSERRFKVEFTASAELRDKLELVRDLMSHANPSRDLGVVVERAVDLLLEQLEKAKLGRARHPRTNRSKQPTKPGRVTRQARREIFERDGLRCSYVAPDGRRCEARAFLELDHTAPRGLGGTDDPDNVRVRCRAHNLLWAEQVYGREHVERRRHFRQREWRSERAEERGFASEAPAPSNEARAGLAAVSAEVSKEVRRALVAMGFRDAAARRAIAEVAGRHDDDRASLQVEHVLREALRVVDCGPGSGGARRGRTATCTP